MMPTKKRDFERAIVAAQTGGFIGMLGYYSAVLAGLVDITSNFKLVVFFFLSSAVVALIGAANRLFID